MEEKFLPIGTVCRLKGGEGYVMITGFCVIPSDGSTEMYDYYSCRYPYGIISQDEGFVFNHDQIEEVAYKGYMSETEKEFKKNLKEILEKSKKENIKTSDKPIALFEETTDSSIEVL